MPHIPDFPSPSDDTGDDGHERERRGIIDRIIGDGNWPTTADPRPVPLAPTPAPARSR